MLGKMENITQVTSLSGNIGRREVVLLRGGNYLWLEENEEVKRETWGRASPRAMLLSPTKIHELSKPSSKYM